ARHADGAGTAGIRKGQGGILQDHESRLYGMRLLHAVSCGCGYTVFLQLLQCKTFFQGEKGPVAVHRFCRRPDERETLVCFTMQAVRQVREVLSAADPNQGEAQGSGRRHGTVDNKAFCRPCEEVLFNKKQAESLTGAMPCIRKF